MMKLVAAFCTCSVNMPKKSTFWEQLFVPRDEKASAYMDLTKSNTFSNWTTCQVFKLQERELPHQESYISEDLFEYKIPTFMAISVAATLEVYVGSVLALLRVQK